MFLPVNIQVKILNIKNLRRVRVVGPVEVDGVDNMVNLRYVFCNLMAQKPFSNDNSGKLEDSL